MFVCRFGALTGFFEFSGFQHHLQDCFVIRLLVGGFQGFDTCPATCFCHINVGMVFSFCGPFPPIGVPTCPKICVFEVGCPDWCFSARREVASGGGCSPTTLSRLRWGWSGTGLGTVQRGWTHLFRDHVVGHRSARMDAPLSGPRCGGLGGSTEGFLSAGGVSRIRSVRWFARR